MQFLVLNADYFLFSAGSSSFSARLQRHQVFSVRAEPEDLRHKVKPSLAYHLLQDLAVKFKLILKSIGKPTCSCVLLLSGRPGGERHSNLTC